MSKSETCGERKELSRLCLPKVAEKRRANKANFSLCSTTSRLSHYISIPPYHLSTLVHNDAMDGNSGQVPDLQSILSTLANFAPPTQQSQSTTSPTEYDGTSEQKAQPIPLLLSKTGDPRLRPQGRSTASPKPNIDPAAITSWSDGLRCVTKIAAQNAQFATSIRKVGSAIYVSFIT